MTKSLLFIGFFDSPHFARWVENTMRSTDYDVTLFCSSPARKMNVKLQQLISENISRISISDGSPKLPVLTYILDKIPFVNLRSRALAREIDKNHDLIHYFEMQHSGYLLLPILEKLKSKKIAYSNYGSDIFWYRRNVRHSKKMSKVLQVTNLVFYECDRDLDFLNEECPASANLVWLVNSGGLRPRQGHPRKDKKQIIAVKGYSNKWGMGLRAVSAVIRLRNILRQRELSVLVYSASLSVAIYCKALAIVAGLRIQVYRKGALSHEEMLEVFSMALIHLALSKSDGIPSSTLEAMRQGALPIQSNSACMSQIIEDGSNGFLVHPKDKRIPEIIRNSIVDETLRHNATAINHRLIEELFNAGDVASKVAAAYKKLLQHAE